MTALLLDLAGRLHQGDRVLPWAPATVCRHGAVDDPRQGLAPLEPLADVTWRETVMEAHERQRGTTCAALAPAGWVCEEHGAKGVAGCQGPWMPAESRRGSWSGNLA